MPLDIALNNTCEYKGGGGGRAVGLATALHKRAVLKLFMEQVSL